MQKYRKLVVIPILLTTFIFTVFPILAFQTVSERIPTSQNISERVYELEKQQALTQLLIEKNEEARVLRQAVDQLHFEALNHEAVRVKEVQDSYWLKSDAVASEKAIRVSMKELSDKIDALNSFKDNYQGQQAVMTVGISLGVTLIGLIANYFLNRKTTKNA